VGVQLHKYAEALEFTIVFWYTTVFVLFLMVNVAFLRGTVTVPLKPWVDPAPLKLMAEPT
jgi:hypothetical protein